MKVTQAILLLALVGSVNAFADLAPGTMNCQAALDGATADKQAAAKKAINTVYADNTTQAPRAQSTGKSTSGR
jgi:hypothetical protein